MVAAIQHNYKISAFKGKWVHWRITITAENITCACQSKYVCKYAVGYSTQLLLFTFINSCIVDTCFSCNKTSLSLLFLFCFTVLMSLITIVICYFTQFRRKMVSYRDWYGNVDILELCFESISYDLVMIYKIRNALGKEIQVLNNIWWISLVL